MHYKCDLDISVRSDRLLYDNMISMGDALHACSGECSSNIYMINIKKKMHSKELTDMQETIRLPYFQCNLNL